MRVRAPDRGVDVCGLDSDEDVGALGDGDRVREGAIDTADRRGEREDRVCLGSAGE